MKLKRDEILDLRKIEFIDCLIYKNSYNMSQGATHNWKIDETSYVCRTCYFNYKMYEHCRLGCSCYGPKPYYKCQNCTVETKRPKVIDSHHIGRVCQPLIEENLSR